MEKDLIYLRKIIEDNGYIFTRQKEYILKILIKSTIHLSAEEIYNNVKKHSVGISTVYRSLKVFSKLNIIKEMSANGTNYYEMKIFSEKPLNIHFKCVKCNSIIDIDYKSLEVDYLKLNSKIQKEKNLIVSDVNIMLIGLCNKCREDENVKTN